MWLVSMMYIYSKATPTNNANHSCYINIEQLVYYHMGYISCHIILIVSGWTHTPMSQQGGGTTGLKHCKLNYGVFKLVETLYHTRLIEISI